MAAEKVDNKRKFKELDSQASAYKSQLQKIEKMKSEILTKDGYKKKPHLLLWLLFFLALIIALVWFLFLKKGV
jgi:hypothetical protein